jgi:hypothetical protein
VKYRKKERTRERDRDWLREIKKQKKRNNEDAIR